MAKLLAVFVERDGEDNFTVYTNADEPTKGVNSLCALTAAVSDAHLIAAAPDMLAALTDARETLTQICEGQHPDNMCCHHLRAVEAAIAKATGSAP